MFQLHVSNWIRVRVPATCYVPRYLTQALLTTLEVWRATDRSFITGCGGRPEAARARARQGTLEPHERKVAKPSDALLRDQPPVLPKLNLAHQGYI
jgi:hypothetical protein